YIRKYKENYSLDVLKKQLVNQGYNEIDINEAVRLATIEQSQTETPKYEEVPEYHPETAQQTVNNTTSTTQKKNSLIDKALQGKDWNFYIEAIKKFIIIFVAWKVLTIIIGFIPIVNFLMSIPIAIIGWLLLLGLPAYAGRELVKKQHENFKIGISAGGILGLATGVIGFLLMIISLIIHPDIFGGIIVIFAGIPHIIYSTILGGVIGGVSGYLAQQGKI
ncbi:MAG: hypothetical protein KKF89_06045, partial [Nanoarchaeota archaeon]|nr:hypothetical protein [Nanoarchaeota archaeon]